MRSLLVTGGAGFIGANFVHYWLKTHPRDRVTVLDALTYAGNRANLNQAEGNEQFAFVHGDIRDSAVVQSVMDEREIDTIVHFAAESHVDRSIEGPDVFIDTNVNGTHCLLKAARRAWLGREGRPHRFHHVSTDEVYGSLSATDPAFSESTPYAPNSPYSASKAASDHLVRAYAHTYGLATTTSNCSNNYGPFHFPEKLIPLAIVNLLQGKPLPVYGDGLNIRDWLHVDDHCRAIDLVLNRGVVGETYNVGGRAESTNIDLVRILCGIADARLADPELAARFPDALASRKQRSVESIRFVTDRPGHDRRYAVDCSKLERELGFGQQIRLETGLAAVFDWYVSNEAWWRSILDGSYRIA